VRPVGRVRGQHDLGIRRHFDLHGPRPTLGDRDPACLGIVLGAETVTSSLVAMVPSRLAISTPMPTRELSAARPQLVRVGRTVRRRTVSRGSKSKSARPRCTIATRLEVTVSPENDAEGTPGPISNVDAGP